MKIQCQSCQAKYTIADEKVLGKVVKIRCKKCSSTIVINGNEHQPAADDAAETNVFDYANQSNEQWTVNVADGDQRTLTVAEIAAEYKTGVINDETYCWKDGMADWLPLREIDQIYAGIKNPRPGSIADISPQSVPPAAAPLFGGKAADTASPFAGGAGGSATHASGNGNGTGGALFAGGAAEPAAAARRAGGRAQGADLFSNVEKAGGEEDVMTSAATGGGGGGGGAAAAPAVDDKLTGQRNENSVLFSLSALTDKKDGPAPSGGGSLGSRTTATSDGSGLIDIRALSANMDEGERKNGGAKVDDIMNLSGGGAFGAALAAPILAPPPLEPVDLGVIATGSDSPKQNKSVMFGILGGAVIIAVAIVAVFVLRAPAAPTASKDNTSPNGTLSAAPNPSTPDPSGTGTGAVAMNDPNAKPGDTTPPPPGTGQATAKPGSPVSPAPHGGTHPAEHGNNATPSPPPAPAPATPTGPKDLGGALAEAAGHPTAAPANNGGGGSTAAFDRGAAAASLANVSNAIAACKKSDGPTGGGHVTVTFMPDGSVQSAVIDSGPFSGTTVGGCVAGKFRGAHVPAFGGAPVRVGKSFTL